VSWLPQLFLTLIGESAPPARQTSSRWWSDSPYYDGRVDNMKNDSRLCIIGIDALDPDLLERWRADLPTFERLMKEGRWTRLESTFPPDSIPAWTSIYTGRDPSEHGALEYVDYLDIRHGATTLSNERLKGHTFWDVASDAGREVLVANPFLAYPTWPVKGLMVSGPVFVDGRVSVHPPDAVFPEAFPELGGMVEFPSRKTLGSFYDRCVRITRAQAEFYSALLRTRSWDLAYVLFLTLDRIKHFYWRFEDREDPCHVAWPAHPAPVREFYKLLDELLAQLLGDLPPGTTTLVLSDHGHQRRCTELFYVNEWLRREELLAVPTRLGWADPRVILERAKNTALDLAYRLELEETLAAMAQWVPGRKQLKRSDHVIRGDNSLARASSFAGVNPFGGIVLNEAEISRRGDSRQRLTDQIISGIRHVVDPRTGRTVVRWVAPRAQVIRNGARQEAYPDILFELDPAYGVSWSVFRPMFGPSVTHRKISGGHTRHGVILAAGPLREGVWVEHPSVVDVFSLVLRQLGLSP